jgi:hypothetical protein
LVERRTNKQQRWRGGKVWTLVRVVLVVLAEVMKWSAIARPKKQREQQ